MKINYVKLTLQKHNTYRPPYLIPDDSAAIDERGEHSESTAEHLTDGTHAQDDVQILLAPRNKIGKQLHGRMLSLWIRQLCWNADSLAYLSAFLSVE